MPKSTKPAVFYFIYLFLIVMIFFTAIELLLRTRIIQLSFNMHGYDFVLDKKFLYRIKPHCCPDINSHGYRTGEYSIKKSKKRILFLGDSFVMGKDVKSEEALPSRLSRRLGDGFEIINMGMVGYGPDQSLIQLRQEALALDPDLVILGIYPANDFKDIARNELFVFDLHGNLAPSRENVVTKTIPGSEIGYLWEYLLFRAGRGKAKYEELFTTLFNDGFDYPMLVYPDRQSVDFRTKAMYAVLHQFKAELDKKNIPMVIVIFPAHEQIENQADLAQYGIPKEKYFYMDNVITYFSNNLKIPALPVYPFFMSNPKTDSRYETGKTNHYTAAANDEIAALLSAFLQKGDLLPK